MSAVFKPGARVYVAGHRGLVGSALCRGLERHGFTNLITRELADLDLRDQGAVEAFFTEEKPEFVFLAAAKVGGIIANSTRPAEFIFENLAIQNNIIDACHRHGTEKLLFLGSSCIYPKLAPQPMPESCLLTGPLEPTNQPYAIAKIAGIEMCQSYHRQYGMKSVCLMPTNLFGPGDNFDLTSSHVMPAMIRKFHEAKKTGGPVVLWGTGTPRREFLHSDDLADAALFLMENLEAGELVNVGRGEDISIRELAELIARVVGYEGEVEWDTSKPDGTPRKLMDVTRMTGYGWKAKIGLEEGIRSVYDWYLAQN
ncbi:MAG: GDP-L-fucose synthase [Fimbriimonadaceae bacterium]|nr:GDP-L-fucose synthase [Fimbriimonadaceae bacterium]